MQRLVAIAGDYYVIAWQINLFAQNVAVFVSRLSIKRWRMWVGESRRALGRFPSARSLDACLPTCRSPGLARTGWDVPSQKIQPHGSDLHVLAEINQDCT